MDFFHPGMLSWLPLGLIPIIIYYLMRFRSLKIAWGAEYVLMRALERLKKRTRLDQLLLLLVRVLACLLFVVTFARLVSPDRDAVLSSSGIHRIILVDTSGSMAAADRQGARWERGLEMMKRASAAWGRGERWSLVAAEETPRWIVRDGVIEESGAIAAALDQLRPADRKASLPRALDEIARAAAGSKMELYIIADDQALSWDGIDTVSWGGGALPPVFWINPSLESHANLAITRVRTGADRVLCGHAMRTEVTVRNFGAEPVTDTPVSLLIDGIHAAQIRLSLLPGQAVDGAADLVFSTPGSHRVSARLGGDVLASDNELSAGVDAVASLKVAVLRKPGVEGKFQSAWPVLELFGRAGLAADENGQRLFTAGTIACSVADPGKVDAWKDADAVVVDSASGAGKPFAQSLSQYMARGGGVLFAPDENTDAAVWNRDFADLLPVKLGKPHILPLEGDRFRSIDPSQIETGLLRAFLDPADGDLSASRIFAWYELPEPKAGADVRARFDNHQPFLIAARKAPGMALLAATGLTSSNNNLLVREFSAALFFRLALQAAEGGVFPRTVARGEPIRLALPGDAGIKAVLFSRGDEAPAPLSPLKRGILSVAETASGSAELGACSLLVVDATGNRRIWFGVQGEWRDSDLSPLSPERLEALKTAWGMHPVTTWAEFEELLRQQTRATELHPWCILGLFVLLLCEMILQRRFV